MWRARRGPAELLALGGLFFAVTLVSALIHFRSLSTSLKHPVLLLIYLSFLAIGEREGRAGGEPLVARAVSLHLFTVVTVAATVLVMAAAWATGLGSNSSSDSRSILPSRAGSSEPTSPAA